MLQEEGELFGAYVGLSGLAECEGDCNEDSGMCLGSGEYSVVVHNF